MISQLESIVDAIEGVSTPILFSLIVFELVILWFRKKWHSKKESWVSLGVFTHMHKDFVPNTPVLDKYLVTPALHGVHHAKNPLYIDTNFANMFSFWDGLLGTFQRKLKDVEPVFGVTDEIVNGESIFSSQFGLWKILFADMRSTPKWSDRVKYFFMPPGWYPRAELSLPLTPGDRELA